LKNRRKTPIPKILRRNRWEIVWLGFGLEILEM
jgi:hypothetical protein